MSGSDLVLPFVAHLLVEKRRTTASSEADMASPPFVLSIGLRGEREPAFRGRATGTGARIFHPGSATVQCRRGRTDCRSVPFGQGLATAQAVAARRLAGDRAPRERDAVAGRRPAVRRRPRPPRRAGMIAPRGRPPRAVRSGRSGPPPAPRGAGCRGAERPADGRCPAARWDRRRRPRPGSVGTPRGATAGSTQRAMAYSWAGDAGQAGPPAVSAGAGQGGQAWGFRASRPVHKLCRTATRRPTRSGWRWASSWARAPPQE